MSFLSDRVVVLGILCCIFILTNEVHCWQHLRETPKTSRVTISKDSIRLVDGSKRCSGRLQVKSVDFESWHYVCHLDFTDQNALATCRDFNCGFIKEHYAIPMSLNVFELWNAKFNCNGTEQRLADCPTSRLGSTRKCRPIALECSKYPRLPQVTVFSPHGSSHEWVYRGHSYVIICRIETTLKVRSFVLHVDDSEWSQPAVDNEAHFFIPLSDKSFSFSCQYNFEFEPQTFSESQYDSVVIKEPSYVRLVGGESRCLGVLELQQEEPERKAKEWRAVSQRNWGLKEAAVVCRQLDCGSVISSETQSTELSSVWSFYSDCDGSERALLGCGNVKGGQSTSTIRILCSDILHPANIRVSSLKISSTLNATVVYSPYSFDVTCSVLPQFPGGHFSLVFTGVKQSLSQNQTAVNHSAVFTFALAEKYHTGKYSCVYHNFVHGRNFSSQSQNITVIVEDTVKLDDGVTDDFFGRVCSGTLLVQDMSQKLMVTAETLHWDIKHAEIVCRQLGCGSALSTSTIQVPKVFPMWRFFSDCDGSESALLQCGHVDKWFSSKAIKVVCQG